MDKPLVSVITITYKHEKYILETVKSVLNQETDFSYEYIIADDCSPDNTENIARGYIAKHPKSHLVIYSKHENNKGVEGNFNWALKKAKGKYIAVCEGDDYWTDNYKLQRQIDFLEENPKYVLTFHSYINKRIGKDGVIESTIKSKPLLLSVVFKNLTSEMPSIENCPNCDRFILTYYSLKGKFKYIDNISPSIRRIHPLGVMSMVSPKKRVERQVQTWSAIYHTFQHTRLKRSLVKKMTFYKFKELLLDWNFDSYIETLYILFYPIKVMNLRLYKLLYSRVVSYISSD